MPTTVPVVAGNWVPLLTVLLAAVVGLSTLFVAFQQWVTANRKVNLDIYDRRMKVYEALLTFMRSWNFQDPELFTTDDLTKLWLGTTPASFLFRPEVAKYIRDEFIPNANNMRYSRWDFLHGERQDVREKGMELKHKMEAWLAKQDAELVELFKPYLYFGDIKPRGTFWETYLRYSQRDAM